MPVTPEGVRRTGELRVSDRTQWATTVEFLHSYGRLMEAITALAILSLIAAAFGLWLYALVHVIRSPDTGSKMMWLLVILLGHGVGAVLYLLMGRRADTAT
jgi:phospholipase D-like protein